MSMLLWIDIAYVVLSIACLIYVLKTRKKSRIIWILSTAILVIVLLISALGILSELGLVTGDPASNDLGMTTYTLFFIGVPLVIALGVGHIQIRRTKKKQDKDGQV